MSVCLSARISQRPHGKRHQIFVHVAHGRGLVLHCWRCDVSCTSGFVDDVMFSHNWLHCASCIGSITAKTTTPILTKFRWTINISKCTSWVEHWGRSLLYTTSLAFSRRLQEDFVYTCLQNYTTDSSLLQSGDGE